MNAHESRNDALADGAPASSLIGPALAPRYLPQVAQDGGRRTWGSKRADVAHGISIVELRPARAVDGAGKGKLPFAKVIAGRPRRALPGDGAVKA